jgi:hypothetical protein
MEETSLKEKFVVRIVRGLGRVVKGRVSGAIVRCKDE